MMQIHYYTSDEKVKIIEMILSSDAEVRHLGMNLACLDPEWILSLRKGDRTQSVDFCDSCEKRVEGINIIYYFFQYKEEYYRLYRISFYASLYIIEKIPKEDFHK